MLAAAASEFQKLVYLLSGPATRPSQAEFRYIVGEHTADIVQFGGGHGILRSHHLDVVGDARLVTLSRQPEVLFGHFAISLRDLNLSGGRLQVQKRIPNFALDAADRIFDLSLARAIGSTAEKVDQFLKLN